MRCFIFLDESGDASTTPDPRFNVFVLCGVLFTEADYRIFDEAFKKLKIQFFGDPTVVFHSYEMRKQTGIFRIFNDKSVLDRFYQEIGKIFKEHEYTVIACVVDKEAYVKRYPTKNQVYEDSLMFICERSISLVGRKNKDVTLHFCLEKRGKKDRYLKKYYTNFRKYGTEYYSTSEFQMCDSKLFFRGKESRVNGLEFADLCAFPIGIKSLHPDRNQPTYELLKPKFYKNFLGKIEGWGLKRFP